MNELNSGVAAVISKLVSTDNSKPNDYYDEENYLICGKCHTRKQTDADMSCLGLGIRRVGMRCKCEDEWLEEKKREAKEAESLKRIKILQERGIADPQYLQCRIENDDGKNKKVSDAIVRYTEKWDEMKAKNMGILFYGTVGTGKTFFAACIANRLIEQGIPALMTNIPALITAMTKNREEDKAEILNRISRTPLLILDDLGVERDTSFGYEKVQEIIDTRYRSGKPLIVTTNLSPKELKEPQDLRYKRVYDRVLEMCYPILVDGVSRRRLKAQNKREAFERILDI